MFKEIIGILHLILTFLMSLFAFIIPQRLGLDFLYMLWHFLVIIHWTFINGECIITYIIKKLHYSNYQAGDDAGYMMDTSLVVDRNIAQFIMGLSVVISGISITLVLIRNKYLPVPLICVLMVMYYIYLLLLRTSNGTNVFKTFQEVYKVVAIVCFLIFLSKIEWFKKQVCK